MKILLYIVLFSFLINLFLFIVFRFWVFFRDPKRIIPEGSNIVAPADGKIIYIRKIENGEVPLCIKKGKRIDIQDICQEPLVEFKYIIGIYMTELSVHINRTPIEGIIRSSFVKEHPNQSMLHLMLNILFKLMPYEQNSICSIENTKRITFIDGPFTVGVVQIADKWINRIDFYKNREEPVMKGEKIGMIRMGSQCDLLLPDIQGLAFKVKEGDWVKAGRDIIAEYVKEEI